MTRKSDGGILVGMARLRRVQRRNVRCYLRRGRDLFRPLLRGRGRRKRAIPTVVCQRHNPGFFQSFSFTRKGEITSVSRQLITGVITPIKSSVFLRTLGCFSKAISEKVATSLPELSWQTRRFARPFRKYF
jgi:hypothetical protein